jgi:hypothetical protein
MGEVLWRPTSTTASEKRSRASYVVYGQRQGDLESIPAQNAPRSNLTVPIQLSSSKVQKPAPGTSTTQDGGCPTCMKHMC